MPAANWRFTFGATAWWRNGGSRPLDMLRTVVNVTGDFVVAAIVAPKTKVVGLFLILNELRLILFFLIPLCF